MRRIATEYGPDGVTLVSTMDVDLNGVTTRTTYAPDGSVSTTETLPGLPIPPLFPPLDEAGALATLLAVIGTITVQEAANIEQISVEHVEHEALAWAVAASLS